MCYDFIDNILAIVQFNFYTIRYDMIYYDNNFIGIFIFIAVFR